MAINTNDLSESTKAELISIATASLITWDMMSEEEKAKFANVEEFTGFMVLGTASQIVNEEEDDE